MTLELYISNFPEDFSDEQIVDLFSEFGEASISKRTDVHRVTGEPLQSANLDLDTDATYDDVFEHFLGHKVGDQYLYITRRYPEDKPPFLDKSLHEIAREIAEQLKEDDKQPQRQIRRIINLGGLDFAKQLLANTLEIEEAGGMMIKDGSRRRTLGGVFFWLARNRISDPMEKAIFFNKTPYRQRMQREEAEKRKAEAKKENEENKENKEKKADPKKPAKKSKDAPPKKASKPKYDASSPELAEAQKELEALRTAHQEAQQSLEELKTKPAEARKTGLFSATREVVNLQKKIADLLREYPQLDD